MNSTGNVGNFAIGTPGTGGMRGVGASIMGGSGTGHPLVPQVKLSGWQGPFALFRNFKMKTLWEAEWPVE